MKIKTIPGDAKRIALRPLALGEKTGHHHSLVALEEGLDVNDFAEMFEVIVGAETITCVRVKKDGAVGLSHQEHKAHAISATKPVGIRQGDVLLAPLQTPGDYEVIIQTEVTDWGRAAVID